MSDKPKRGRPRKSTTNIDLDNLTDEQKQELINKLTPSSAPRGTKKTFVNKFVDDGTLCKEDREFTKLVKFSITERSRKPSGKTKNCERCSKPFISHYNAYLCNDCGKSK